MFNLFKKKASESELNAMKVFRDTVIDGHNECIHDFELWKVVENVTGYVATMFCKKCGKIKEISLWI